MPNDLRVLDSHDADYFPDTFPRAGFPRYVWDHRPPGLPAQAWTTETTHRDGQQGGLPLTTDRGLRIYDLLCSFTGKSGAIRQAEFFAYSETDRRILHGAQERFGQGAPIEPTTWIRASRKDVALVAKLGVAETGMLASASDYHTFHKFSEGGRRRAAETYLDAVRMALDAGIKPRLHLEDATRASMEFILPFGEAVLSAAEGYGDWLRPKLRVCDTMGLGLPYESVELPRSIPRIFRDLRANGWGPEDLEFHPHNDTWLVVANCLTAIQEGCAVVNGCTLGKGERTGNAPLEAVVLHLIGMGYFTADPPDFTVLNELAALYAEMNEPLPPKYPLFGREAHRTRAGIHADGLNKFWPMYAPFDVRGLLGRPLEVSITKDSGLAGLVFVIKQQLGLDVAKENAGLRSVYAWVTQQFESGRQTSIEWEELQPVVDRFLELSAS